MSSLELAWKLFETGARPGGWCFKGVHCSPVCLAGWRGEESILCGVWDGWGEFGAGWECFHGG